MTDDAPVPARPACWSYRNASAFEAPGVARAYQHRPPYPAEVFTILEGLIRETPRRVLDAGCGNGLLARPLAARVDHVDAVDMSAAMLAEGRRLPGGVSPRVAWIAGRLEDAPLQPPYALITAGESLHWMDWEVVLPRFARVLTPGGRLAIVHNGQLPPPWDAELTALVRRYSTIRDWQRADLIAALEGRGLFRKEGEQQTAPVVFTQPVEAYIEGQHSQSSLARDRLAPEDAAAFDAALGALVAPAGAGMVTLTLVATVVWGRPLSP